MTPLAPLIQVATVEKSISEYDSDDDNSDPTAPVEIIETIVGIGDVPHYGTGGSTTADKPYKIEKYTSINGAKYNNSTALSQILQNPGTALLSDCYPGTLKPINNDKGEMVGYEGNMGVRHGLAFYCDNKLVTTVEIDALDLKVNQFRPVQANSKLLHCLLQNLKNDPKYKLLTSYILSMKKVLATLAIYNDMGFLASVGEVTPGTKDNSINVPVTNRNNSKAWWNSLKVSANNKSEWLNQADHEGIRTKPGSRVFIKTETQTQNVIPEGRGTKPKMRQIYGVPNYVDDSIDAEYKIFVPNKSGVTGNEGWEYPGDRPNITPFTLHWDEWDRILLRNCRARIKKLFRIQYFSARDKPGDKSKQPSAARIKLKNLKARLFPSPGAGMLPWWKRRKLRPNPYNAKGQMCNGPDMLGNE